MLKIIKSWKYYEKQIFEDVESFINVDFCIDCLSIK